MGERGERIESIVERSGELQGQAEGFARSATNVARQQWWHNARLVGLAVVLLGLLLLLIFKPLWFVILMGIVLVLTAAYFFFSRRREYQSV
eukprot:NODE_7155_length_470_cov_52.306413_g6336_i0.p1 GENE.NODE_7155_length_470_cov_52.306413_g6336_i0~~NODE_7155_length_470_cov_52.306413_g6336_i0.p1  ORF type:complete len:91 (+),score=27.66 NODE_7155_length_470_cov_52.306413_g6336_i0:42-314(+)